MEHDANNTLICRCEEVTRGDVLTAIRNGCHTVASIKRATRAGMGACQGRTCGRLIQQLLLAEGVQTPETLTADKPRFPIVPCSVESLIGKPESTAANSTVSGPAERTLTKEPETADTARTSPLRESLRKKPETDDIVSTCNGKPGGPDHEEKI